MTTVGIGIVGYGYWGPNLARNIAKGPGTSLVAICDKAANCLEEAGRSHPQVKLTADYDELLANPSIDAIIIATPVSSHYQLASAAMAAGKHVLVEKPIAASASEACRLIDQASAQKRVLMVDHTFVFTGAVNKIRELIREESFGQLQYYDSARANLGNFQPDANVLWDLAVHDLSIMNFVMGVSPVAVSATGLSHVSGHRVNTAYMTLYFAANVIGHISVNWLSPVKIRRTLVGGSGRMIVYDDNETSEKVKVFDSGITVTADRHELYKILISYRTGDMWAPKVDGTEALWRVVQHFRECIVDGKVPLCGGEQGLGIVRTLEAADESMRQRGAPVSL
ncbi:MAG TPA: Gfo/Idh/MocA family oxidoreductase [Vicinamibacterales bacterium]